MVRSGDGWAQGVAGTGEPGSDGDGGAAAAAKVDEPVGLALASDGTLFLSDFPAGRVRRVDPGGTISTLARLRQPAEVALDVAERSLAVPSLADVLHRVDLATGETETLTHPDEPHGAVYDEAGSQPSDVALAPDGALIVSQIEPTAAIRRVDPDTGVITTLLR